MPNPDENNPNPNSNPPAETNWYDGVDETLLTDKVKGFTNSDGTMNVAELLKSYNSAQSYIGGSVKIPTDKSSPEEVAAFYSKLGRPESADKYDWQPPADVSVEGATEENFKNFKQLCFDSGMTNKQVSAVMNGWSNVIKDLFAKQAAAREQIARESKAALSAQNEWGGDYQTRLDAVLNRVEKLGIKEKLEYAGLLYDKDVLKAFDAVISASSETRIKGADGKFINPQERLEQLKNNPAYFQAGHPDHAKVIEEANSIMAQMANTRG